MDWDDARYFLAVARAGQMLAASRRLGVSQALLSRRVAALEAAVGARLMDRTPRGCVLTEAGHELFAAAERMEDTFLAASARVRGAGEAISGTIRIGAPDGFGTAFLAGRLGALRALYPSLSIQLAPITRSFSLLQREADLAVMVGRPERGRLRVRKLTDYTLGLYASRAYLARAGHPRTPADLADHAKVGYVEDLIYTPELQYVQEFLPEWQSEIEVSSALGQLHAVRGGAGIGVLHDFMVADLPDLVRLMPERVARRTYWMVWHENVRAPARVRAVGEALAQMVLSEHDRFVRPGQAARSSR